MTVLVGTRSGLVDPMAGAVVDFTGRDVRAISGEWVVLDGREVRRRGRPHDDPAAPPVQVPQVTCVVDGAESGAAAIVGTAEAHLYRLDSTAERIEAFEAVEGRHEWYTPWGGPADVRSLATSPEGTVLVNVHVGGIVRSDDGGASWHPTIDIHTDVHQVLALGGGRALAACAAGLATSDDDGETWTVEDEGLHATYARAVAVAGDMALLSVSNGPHGGQAAVYRRPLSEHGALERCQGLPEDLGGNIDTFWLAGGPDGEVALATAGGDVYESKDQGATWLQVADHLAPVRCLTLR